MPKPQRSTADILEQCAGEMHSVAFDFREDARTHGYAEARIAEVERICSAARAAVRGSGQPIGPTPSANATDPR